MKTIIVEDKAGVIEIKVPDIQLSVVVIFEVRYLADSQALSRIMGSQKRCYLIRSGSQLTLWISTSPTELSVDAVLLTPYKANSANTHLGNKLTA